MIEKLDWDSDFFGYEVGKLNISDGASIDEHLLLEDARGYKLVYLVSDKEIDFKSGRLQLVDIKTRVTRKITGKEKSVQQYQFENVDAGCDQLKDLALQSGAYSRFKNDPHFVLNEFERLYLKWMQDSIHKIIADDVIALKDGANYEGFVSVKFRETFSEIGLIAVQENSRGRGIGKGLLDYVNNLTLDKGLAEIQVTTQFENIPAMNLYTKAGYHILSKKYIYHLWN